MVTATLLTATTTTSTDPGPGGALATRVPSGLSAPPNRAKLWPVSETGSQNGAEPIGEGDAGGVDPRRAMWRRGSYEIVGDWLRPASIALLDRVEEATGEQLTGKRLLDVATGTGAVAIEAARRGASLTAVDLTDELLAVAERRATEAGAEIDFALGDFDRLTDAIGDDTFDIITSSFGVIFAPDPAATANDLIDRLRPGGCLAVTAWDPHGPMMVPDNIIELLPAPPSMPDMSVWATGIDELFAPLPAQPLAHHVDTLEIEFESAADCALQFERWAGGWAQLFDALDQAGTGDVARQRFVEHLGAFAAPASPAPFLLRAGYHTSVAARDEGHSRSSR